MEEVLKRIGRRAEELGEQEGHRSDRVINGLILQIRVLLLLHSQRAEAVP
jgi:hypothetical protein